MRAYTPGEIVSISIPVLPLKGEFLAAFGQPSMHDNWYIDGDSASGKSSFAMMLGKELTKYGKVLYVSLEEGVSLSFQRRMELLNMKEVNSKFSVVVRETVVELAERLAKPKSAQFVIIDSIQYLDVRSFDQLKKLILDQFPRKAFIFVSQCYKGKPKGKLADDVKFDCGVKIHTRGYRAYCSGRFVDDVAAYYTIWEEGAVRFDLNE